MRGGSLVPLLWLWASTASAEVELGAGPNLQVTRGSSPDDGSVGTGFLARALVTTGSAHSLGVMVEGLWLMPTQAEPSRGISQQDLVVVNRYRPPVGQRETLAIDVGLGATHFSGIRDTVNPTLQFGLSIAAPLSKRLVVELGARLTITPNVFYPGEQRPWALPQAATTRFGGLLSARL